MLMLLIGLLADSLVSHLVLAWCWLWMQFLESRRGSPQLAPLRLEHFESKIIQMGSDILRRHDAGDFYGTPQRPRVWLLVVPMI
ncbi:hypothetical protein BJ912DRAFT_237068 [Pholiota molesta]|nr:hypothetical protein BJ912DRAFT_237068 [Pholiota molesta]